MSTKWPCIALLLRAAFVGEYTQQQKHGNGSHSKRFEFTVAGDRFMFRTFPTANNVTAKAFLLLTAYGNEFPDRWCL